MAIQSESFQRLDQDLETRARDGLMWKDAEARRHLLEKQGFGVSPDHPSMKNDEVGMAAGVYTFGEHYAFEELPQVIEEHLEEFARRMDWPEVPEEHKGGEIPNTGFEGSYWGHVPESREELVATQVAMIEKMTWDAAEAQGMEHPSQLAFLDVAITAPATELLDEYLSEVLEIPMDKIRVGSGACNSMGKMFAERAEGDDEGVGVEVGLEAMMMYRQPIEGEQMWQGTTDRPALAFFSDGGSYVAYDPSRVDLLAAYREERVDDKGILAVNTAGLSGENGSGGWRGEYIKGRGWVTEEGAEDLDSIVYRRGDSWTVELQNPAQVEVYGEVWQPLVVMNLGPTTKHFMGVSGRLSRGYREAEKKAKEVGLLPEDFSVEGDGVVVTTHRPSNLVHEAEASGLLGLTRSDLKRSDEARARLERFQQEKMPWRGELGNQPCTILGHEFRDKLMQMEAGGYLVGQFFGAGGTGEGFVARIA